MINLLKNASQIVFLLEFWARAKECLFARISKYNGGHQNIISRPIPQAIIIPADISPTNNPIANLSAKILITVTSRFRFIIPKIAIKIHFFHSN